MTILCQMSFATHRMRPPDVKVTSESKVKLSSVDISPFFSNSGLVDYKSGVTTSMENTETPPSGPTPLVVSNFEVVNDDPKPRTTPSLSAEDTARNIARQFTQSSSALMDSDTILLQSEFRRLSKNGKLPSFEAWVGADVNRKMMLKAGAEEALRKQYDNMTGSFLEDMTKKAKSAVRKFTDGFSHNSNKKKPEEDEDVKDGKPIWQPSTSSNVSDRLTAVENHISHLSVGMKDHTQHLRQLREGMQNHTHVLQHTVDGMHNHTDVLKHTVEGMHNHTAALKTLSADSHGVNSKQEMKNFAMRSTQKGRRMSNKELTDKL